MAPWTTRRGLCYSATPASAIRPGRWVVEPCPFPAAMAPQAADCVQASAHALRRPYRHSCLMGLLVVTTSRKGLCTAENARLGQLPGLWVVEPRPFQQAMAPGGKRRPGSSRPIATRFTALVVRMSPVTAGTRAHARESSRCLLPRSSQHRCTGSDAPLRRGGRGCGLPALSGSGAVRCPRPADTSVRCWFQAFTCWPFRRDQSSVNPDGSGMPPRG